MAAGDGARRREGGRRRWATATDTAATGTAASGTAASAVGATGTDAGTGSSAIDPELGVEAGRIVEAARAAGEHRNGGEEGDEEVTHGWLRGAGLRARARGRDDRAPRRRRRGLPAPGGTRRTRACSRRSREARRCSPRR